MIPTPGELRLKDSLQNLKQALAEQSKMIDKACREDKISVKEALELSNKNLDSHIELLKFELRFRSKFDDWS
jgi:F0F1-type ATP synthase membrane subunit b/b'